MTKINQHLMGLGTVPSKKQVEKDARETDREERHIAMQVAQQLPLEEESALRILDLARCLVMGFLAGRNRTPAELEKISGRRSDKVIAFARASPVWIALPGSLLLAIAVEASPLIL